VISKKMPKQPKKAVRPKHQKKTVTGVKKQKTQPKKGFSTRQTKKSQTSTGLGAKLSRKEVNSDREVLPKLKELLKENEWNILNYPVLYHRMIQDKHGTVLKQIESRFSNVKGLALPIQFVEILWNSIEKYLVRENKNLDIFKHNQRSIPTLFTNTSLRKFLGTAIMQGITGATSTDMLFQNEGVFIQFPGKEKQLPRRAFGMLGKNLKFDLTHIHQLLIFNFQHHIHPGHFLTIDETRIRETRFSSEHKTFNRNKPAKWGVE
jgi:hypothetical protein